MTKVLELLKKAWQWFVKLIVKKVWILTYPSIVLLAVLFTTLNLWAFVALALWVITIVYNTDEEK